MSACYYHCSARAKLPPNVDLKMTFPLVDGVQSYKPNFAVEEDNHDNPDEKLPDSQGVQGTNEQKMSKVTLTCLLCQHTTICKTYDLDYPCFYKHQALHASTRPGRACLCVRQ